MKNLISVICETALKNVDVYHLKNLMEKLTCFKILGRRSCHDLLLGVHLRHFQDTQVMKTVLLDFHKRNLKVLKICFSKKTINTFYKYWKKIEN